MKSKPKKSISLLMPLPIPEVAWEDVSSDFITSLPKDKVKSVIIVVVDRLTKFCHWGHFMLIILLKWFLSTLYKISLNYMTFLSLLSLIETRYLPMGSQKKLTR